ncbi:MAG: hypothetical protein U0S36_10120 [Candidatus Nanopelagicales bacterium]
MSDAPVPPLVLRAEQSAAALGFGLGCRREVGALLRALVASRPSGVVAESGTGTGIGTAWMQAGLSPDARLLTVERDDALAAAAQDLVADDPRVQVLHGDWTLLVEHAPFDVFFCDGGGKLDSPTSSCRCSRPAASSSSTTSRPRRTGRRSTTGSPTPCASPTSSTPTSSPPRSTSAPT